MLYAGTSGFAYPTWKPRFYPAELSSKRFLEYYAGRLNSVEINYTFRRLPAETTLQNWVAATPDGFVFCPKAHQRITHIARLKEPFDFAETFLRALEPLGAAHRLGPVLFQLPPFLRCDQARLGQFLAALPKGLRYCFEFRHESWLADAVYETLRKYDAALCWAESEKLKVAEVSTASFAYLRLRKPQYSPEERRAILQTVRNLLNEGKDVFTFFKHEETPDGALYAEELLRQV
ncbi:MAG TPA: DUF72 domain-containing protein [Terriglobia bacterium]